MRVPVAAVFAVTAIFILPGATSVFRAMNRLQVVPVNAYELEVVGTPGASKYAYWCAVGDFLRRQRAPWKTRIYAASGIQHGAATGAREAVVFTLDPAASGIEVYENNVVNDLLTVGYGRSLTAAFDECRNPVMQFPF